MRLLYRLFDATGSDQGVNALSESLLGKLVCSGRHDKVIAMQIFDLMRGPPNGDLPPL